MASSPASLKRQMGSAADLQSVVRAMRAQRPPIIGQYEKSVHALTQYALTVDRALGAFLRANQDAFVDPVRKASADCQVVQVVIFGSDQGMVGRFNEEVADFALRELGRTTGTPRIWVVGERMRAALEPSGLPLCGEFSVPGSVQAITTLVTRLLEQVAQEVSTVRPPISSSTLHLFYNRPAVEGGSSYTPIDRRVLPLDEAWRRARTDCAWPTTLLPESIGDPVQTLSLLTREYLFVSLFRACAESLASENASRLAAMERADRNIDKLTIRLQGEYQRVRQRDIDEELADVMAGFKASGAKGD